MRARRTFAVVGIALATWAAPLHAHLMPAQSGTLNVRDRAVFGALSIPVSALAGFDDDGNGRLSALELQRHLVALQQQVSTRLQLTNGADRGTRDFLQLSVELVEDDPASTGGGAHLLVLVKQTFADIPTHLAMHTDLFGPHGAEQQLAIKAMHDSIAELAVLRAGIELGQALIVSIALIALAAARAHSLKPVSLFTFRAVYFSARDS